MFAARRALCLPSVAVRKLATSPARLAATSRVPYTKPTPIAPKIVARAATSTAGRGNPDPVEEYSTTVDEAEVEKLMEDLRGPTNAISNAAASTIAFTGDGVPEPPADLNSTDWYTSYHGLSTQPFPKEVAEVLMAPIDPMDVEMKPDGLLYLPEIKYRRILNRAFGPGGWGLAPRSGLNVSPKVVSREYALVCLGRLVGIARGEQEYFDQEGIATAAEAAKSNALMRCCKDLGIASELWDPRFIREFKAKYCVEVFAEYIPAKRVKKYWRRKDAKFEYPYKETTGSFSGGNTYSSGSGTYGSRT